MTKKLDWYDEDERWLWENLEIGKSYRCNIFNYMSQQNPNLIVKVLDKYQGRKPLLKLKIQVIWNPNNLEVEETISACNLFTAKELKEAKEVDTLLWKALNG